MASGKRFAQLDIDVCVPVVCFKTTAESFHPGDLPKTKNVCHTLSLRFQIYRLTARFDVILFGHTKCIKI